MKASIRCCREDLGCGCRRRTSRRAGFSVWSAAAALVFGVASGLAYAGEATTPSIAQAAKTIATSPTVLSNDFARLAFQMQRDGIDLTAFEDLGAKRELLAGDQPFWRIVVEDAAGKRRELNNRTGWQRVSALGGEAVLSLAWRGIAAAPLPAPPQRGEEKTAKGEEGTAAFEVRCVVALNGPRTSWQLAIENNTSATIRNVVFPHVVTRPLGGEGSDDAVVYPAASGQRRIDPFANPVRYTGDYPSGWSTYQFMTHYDSAGGLYVAAHDPVASTKQILTQTTEDKKALRLAFDWPAPDASIPGNDFEMPGPAVVELMRGDWFDAAQIYKHWAQTTARWWPGKEYTRQSPPWVRDIAIWAQTGGTTQSVVGPVRDFAAYMGVPTALHWYNWHEIPFDDNYPHYFPAKPDFREGVAALQAAGVRVMPYINGRLWDTDTEDFATTALPAATKNEKGEPYTEEYGSGQKLAAMCPTAPLWQDKVSDIVLRLLGPECGVDAVYIDQVAAAQPRLCFDRSHGHPLAGGCWWTTRGYWPMLERLRGEIAKRHPDKMITTECNAEPYVHLFDAYLTWHFQYQDQLPVFAAIYGGQVQLFGRAYRGGPSKDLALRMKAAQSLVFGEQIGWCGPDVIKEEINGPFMRQIARLRYGLRDFLADGEMARPPQIAGDIPLVTADWQWQKEWPITDSALQAGAWRARDGRLALVFVNVTSATLAFNLGFDGRTYGLTTNELLAIRRTELAVSEPEVVPAVFRRSVRLQPYEALAIELRPALRPAVPAASAVPKPKPSAGGPVE